MMKYSNKWLISSIILLTVLLYGGAVSAETSATTPNAIQPCVGGMAGGYPCHDVNLVAHLSLADLGADSSSGVFANDIWGWRSDAGKAYVMVGLRNGTAFVEVTDPVNPVLVGTLASHEAGLSDYRDIKVYANHAYIVGDQPYTAHGMQIFDLTQLETLDPTTFPVTLSATAHYSGIGYAHNMWINEASGMAYLFRGDQCSAGTQIVDLSTPTAPTVAGCISADGAASDAECVVYDGPDADHTGKEICFIGSDVTALIVDATNPAAPITLASFTYPNILRAHQGALTGDKAYWLISDTMDEMMGAEPNTNTVIIDVRDLDNPQYVRRQSYTTNASDHNIYVKDNLAIMTNWRAGLRIASMSNFASWDEVAYFDTHPSADTPGPKSGAWSHYDQLANGVIAVSDVEEGLFLLRVEHTPTSVGRVDFAGHSNTATPIAFFATLLVAFAAASTYFLRHKR